MASTHQMQLKYPTAYHLQILKDRQHPNDGNSLPIDEDRFLTEADYVDMRQLSYFSDLDGIGSHDSIPFKIASEPIFTAPSNPIPPYQVDSHTIHGSIPIGIKNAYAHRMVPEGTNQAWSAPDSPNQAHSGLNSTPIHPYSMDHASLSASSYEDDPRTQANLQQAMERRRRRRESHNAVERRRRDHINECIQKIGFLLPDDTPEGRYNKSNKGSILQSSIEFIKSLEDQVAQYQSQVAHLEAELRLCRNSQ
ncbi:unnamed protein product [Umbelopsis ramanniana]